MIVILELPVNPIRLLTKKITGYLYNVDLFTLLGNFALFPSKKKNRADSDHGQSTKRSSLGSQKFTVAPQ